MNPPTLSTLAIQKIRRTVERKMNGELDADFINYMKYLLICHGNEVLQMEAAWIFTNIAASSSEHTKFIIDSGVVPLLTNLLSSSNKGIVEQATWALGNICGENPEYHNLVLNHGALELILSSITLGMSKSFQRTAAWCCSNIVRSHDYPTPFKIASEMAPKLCLLIEQHDNVTSIDALWAMTFITNLGDDYIQLFVDEDVVWRVIQLLLSNNERLHLAAMRFLGNVATGSNEQTQLLIDYEILDHMEFALIHPNDNLRRMSLWCLSNITIGKQQHAFEVFQSGLLLAIIDNLQNFNELIVKEAVLTVRNLITFGTNEQMLEIIDNRTVTPLMELMKHNNQEIAKASHQAVTVLFKKSGLLIEKYYRIFIEGRDDLENQ